MLEQLASIPELSGWELAADRGNLSADDEEQLARMQREARELDARARARWEAFTPDEVAAYDAAADGLLSVARDPDLVRRLPPTRSPARAFDGWAIRRVLARV